jgi:hypothetical protein
MGNSCDVFLCFVYREFEEGNEAVRATLELKVADLTRRAGEYGRESAAVVATGEVLAFTAQVSFFVFPSRAIITFEGT